MDLELVRITSSKHPDWNATYVLEVGMSEQDVLNLYGNELRQSWYEEEVEEKVIAPGSFSVTGRVPFCQEDAYTLGLKVGDIL